MANLFVNYYETFSVIMFAIGLMTLILDRNLIKKIVAMNIMDVALFLYLASKGFVRGRIAPIIENGITDPSVYGNPTPAGLVLTGIVVGVCMTAFSLALTQNIYKKYRTLNIDELIIKIKTKEIEEGVE